MPITLPTALFQDYWIDPSFPQTAGSQVSDVCFIYFCIPIGEKKPNSSVTLVFIPLKGGTELKVELGES